MYSYASGFDRHLGKFAFDNHKFTNNDTVLRFDCFVRFNSQYTFQYIDDVFARQIHLKLVYSCHPLHDVTAKTETGSSFHPGNFLAAYKIFSYPSTSKRREIPVGFSIVPRSRYVLNSFTTQHKSGRFVTS